MKKFSQLKGRIREFAEIQGIKISDIYSKTAITDGTFSNASGLNEDSLLKFFSNYPEINPEWLLTGNGPMLKEGKLALKTEQKVDDNWQELAEARKETIELLKKENARLEKELSDIKSSKTQAIELSETTVPRMAPPKKELK